LFFSFDSTTPSPMSDRFALLLGATPPVQEGSLTDFFIWKSKQSEQ